jgi:hypothetical protein
MNVMTATAQTRSPPLEGALADVSVLGRHGECAVLDRLVERVRAFPGGAWTSSGVLWWGRDAGFSRIRPGWATFRIVAARISYL